MFMIKQIKIEKKEPAKMAAPGRQREPPAIHDRYSSTASLTDPYMALGQTQGTQTQTNTRLVPNIEITHSFRPYLKPSQINLPYVSYYSAVNNRQDSGFSAVSNHSTSTHLERPLSKSNPKSSKQSSELDAYKQKARIFSTMAVSNIPKIMQTQKTGLTDSAGLLIVESKQSQVNEHLKMQREKLLKSKLAKMMEIKARLARPKNASAGCHQSDGEVVEIPALNLFHLQEDAREARDESLVKTPIHGEGLDSRQPTQGREKMTQIASTTPSQKVTLRKHRSGTFMAIEQNTFDFRPP